MNEILLSNELGELETLESYRGGEALNERHDACADNDASEVDVEDGAASLSALSAAAMTSSALKPPIPLNEMSASALRR